MQMILVVDVGNTTIRFGLFYGDEIIVMWKIMTKIQKTSDEYTVIINSWFTQHNIDKTGVKGVVISSVVPNVMHSFNNAIRKTFGLEPLIVKAGIKTGISINVDDPREVGPDRIVDAAAAYNLYGGPSVVLDFGTATTYDLINEKGAFISAVTSPGIQISADALGTRTAMLPNIEIVKPPTILAKNTISSMQAGLVYGYVGQVEYIVKRIKKEANYPNATVVATGGYAQVIQEETDVIDIYDPLLTLKGMKIIWDKNNYAK